MGTFLVVQWLRLCACKAGDVGSISGHGLRSYTPHCTTKSEVGGIFANHILNKGLISKIYKGLSQLNNNNKKKQTIIFKMADELNRHSSKDDSKWPTDT